MAEKICPDRVRDLFARKYIRIYSGPNLRWLESTLARSCFGEGEIALANMRWICFGSAYPEILVSHQTEYVVNYKYLCAFSDTGCRRCKSNPVSVCSCGWIMNESTGAGCTIG